MGNTENNCGTHKTLATYMKSLFVRHINVSRIIMKIQNTIPLLIFFISFHFSLISQVPVINNGASITNSAVVKVNGHCYHQNNGSIVNSGNIYLTGNWLNNNSNSVFATGTEGWVRLDGATQTIGGSTYTHFNNLELSGTGNKLLNNADVEIEDTLALNDKEFAAGNNTVFVTNTNTGSVTRANTMSGGFVSSANDGGLSRNTASINAYSFPVGSSTGILRYRPVELTPNSSSANTFKVRMGNVNPTNETYDIALKDSSLCEINSNFYHKIFQTSGLSSCDVKIYYDAVADGSFQTIAHWQNVPQWENTGNNTSTSGSPLSSLTKSGWNDFTTNSFSLAKLVPVASITTNPVCQGGNTVFSAPSGFANYEFFVNGVSQGQTTSNIFSTGYFNNGDVVGVMLYDVITCMSDTNFTSAVINPNPYVTASPDDTINIGEEATLSASGATTYLWQPGNLSGAVIAANPTVETTYTVIGTDANGCNDTATVTIYIDADCVHRLPNVFSPNGDGQNETFKVLGKNLDFVLLSVYDRWGNKVFETSDITGKWDGTYKGALLNNGVYVYIMKGKCKNSNEEFEQHGNVTLTK